MAKTMTLLGATSIAALTDLPKNRFIGLDGNLCAAGEKALGSNTYAVSSGEQVAVELAGIVLIESAGAIAAKKPVVASGTGENAGRAAEASDLAATQSGSTASSTVVEGSTDMTSTAANGADLVTTTVTDGDITLTGSIPAEYINGYAIDAASDAGEYIRVLLA